ncbi:cation:proton antiporter [Butyrivibrio fibrisolvens]|uniref:cation:proton antiporter n=1 Tax=Pseudobutyrivibrio ruminis TaxID=46206 RepID=UPI00040B3B56|nr:cation:proton antiporter [Pseudobutyrivibrio ruminis]MDC7279117.1 cation:proton antiporter [Butyrivibrio fibrisolvens]
MKLETLSENEIAVTFVALALLLLFAFLTGNVMEKIKAPRVVGEITGGILLGATFLQRLFPNMIESIFSGYENEGKVLNIFYQLGLILLMFLSGYNTQIEFDRKNIRTIASIFVGSTLLPMSVGLFFVSYFINDFIGEKGNYISFSIVFIIGIAITSIPVISKIFFDLGVMNTHFSNTVLTVSTFQDLLLWIMLNVALRISSTGEIDIVDLLIVVFATIGMFVVVKIIAEHNIIKILKEINSITLYAGSIAILLLVCALLSRIGINNMYSAFLVGYVIKKFTGDSINAKEKIDYLGKVSFAFFIPIYFALVGIQLDLINNFSLFRFIAFFMIAFCLEGMGTYLFANLSNLNTKSKINFAITMNARGGPGIVLATTAYAYEIINLEFFTVLILTTMLSSLIAGYWLRYQLQKDKSVFMVLTKDV